MVSRGGRHGATPVGLGELRYLVFLLPPHHINFGKQLTKSPKLYFFDTGLAAWLAGIRSADELAISPMRGPLFETWAVAEILKTSLHQRLDAQLFFWRDKIGTEVDLLIDQPQGAQTVEFKAGQTVAGDWFNALRKYEALRPPCSGLSTQPDQPPPRLAQWVWPDPTGSTPTRAVARGRITVGEWPKEVSEWVDRAWGMKYAFSV